MKKIDIYNVGSISPGMSWENIRTRLMENGCRDHGRALTGTIGLILYPSLNVSNNNDFPRPSNVEMK